MLTARPGEKLSATDARGNLQTFTYDYAGRVLSAMTERFTYDTIGIPSGKTDRNGTVFSYAHDALGRRVKETATPAITAPIDQITKYAAVRQTAYTLTGQKAWESVAENGVTLKTSYTYDNRGRLATQTDPGSAVKTYTYDANGNRASFVLKRGSATDISLTYAYDEANRLKTVSQGGAAIAEYTYDANGNRTKLNYPQNGVETTYSYNAANLATTQEHRKNGSVLRRYGHYYAADGNLTVREWDSHHLRYTYDLLGRLTREEETGKRVITYTYDRFGNREKLVVAGVREMGEKSWETLYAYDANNRLLTETKTEAEGGAVEVATYAYDRNGNQIRREQQRTEGSRVRGYIGFATGPKSDGSAMLDTRAYNAFGQLAQANRDGLRVEYTYRPDGLRHQKTVTDAAWQKSTGIYIWDGMNLVEELNGSTVMARYLRGAGLICQLIDSNTFYYLFNSHGDVIQRADQSGNMGVVYDYDAFGNNVRRYNVGHQSTDGLDTDPNPFRYCGEYFDLSSGEYYLRARTYNPANGRFSQEDIAKAGDNWYGYCYNNPILFVDPTGCIPTWAKWVIGGVIIAALIVATVLTGGLATAVGATLFSALGGAVVGGGLGAGFGAFSAAATGGDIADGAASGFMYGTIGGAASGAVGASAMVAGEMVLAQTSISLSTYMLESALEQEPMTLGGIGFAAAGGMVSGAMGGAGLRSSQSIYNGNSNLYKAEIGFLNQQQALALGAWRSIGAGIYPASSEASYGVLGDMAPFGFDYFRNMIGCQTTEETTPLSAEGSLALGRGPIAFTAPETPTSAASALALGRGPIAFIPPAAAHNTRMTVNRTRTNLSPLAGKKTTVYWSNGTRTRAVA